MEEITKEQKKHQKMYRKEFDLAKVGLQEIPGELVWSYHDYEAFKFKTSRATLLFYPHKTGTGNISIRVRDQGSKDKELADLLMIHLDKLQNNITFTRKNHHHAWTFKAEEVMARIKEKCAR